MNHISAQVTSRCCIYNIVKLKIVIIYFNGRYTRRRNIFQMDLTLVPKLPDLLDRAADQIDRECVICPIIRLVHLENLAPAMWHHRPTDECHVPLYLNSQHVFSLILL